MAFTTFQIPAGGTEYPSYATLDEANEFLLIDLARRDGWALLTDQEKQVRLAFALRLIDDAPRMINGEWSGKKHMAGQLAEFPRDGVTCDGEPAATAANYLPQDIVDGAITLAGSLAVNSSLVRIRQPASASGTFPVSLLKGGSAEIQFDTSGSAPAPTEASEVVQLTPDPHVDDLIRCYVAGARAVSAGVFADPRGRAGGSSLSTDTTYRLD